MNLMCPHCLHDVADSKKLLPRLPESGDYAICSECGGLSRYNSESRFEIANDSDLPAELLKEVEVYRYLIKSAHFVHCPPQNVQ